MVFLAWSGTWHKRRPFDGIIPPEYFYILNPVHFIFRSAEAVGRSASAFLPRLTSTDLDRPLRTSIDHRSQVASTAGRAEATNSLRHFSCLREVELSYIG